MREPPVFCTLFDSGYFSRGLAMYESLARQYRDFTLYIFPFDDDALNALQRLALRNVVVVPQSEFEDPELLRIKPTRSRAEYCWTCTASTVLYVLKRFGHSACTYVDADIYFFGSPDALLAELGERDVLITEHRYSPQHAHLAATSGIYCVQFVTFRNNERGLRALRWWREACIESCELNPAEGKCGDQKYLDDWTTRFEGVHVLRHLGGGLAPWNIQQYRFVTEEGVNVGIEKATGARFEPIFYHYHALKMWTTGRVQLSGGYEIARGAFEMFYRPYLRRLDELGRQLKASGIAFDPHGRAVLPPLTLRARAGVLKRRVARLAGMLRPGTEDSVPNLLDSLR